jgi:nucleoside diphosphate kinase
MKYIVSLAILALLSKNTQAISVKSLINDADTEEASKNEAKEFFAEFKPQPT